jgi:hypothetical protein
LREQRRDARKVAEADKIEENQGGLVRLRGPKGPERNGVG